jgi:hypothetical protein
MVFVTLCGAFQILACIGNFILRGEPIMSAHWTGHGDILLLQNLAQAGTLESSGLLLPAGAIRVRTLNRNKNVSAHSCIVAFSPA